LEVGADERDAKGKGLPGVALAAYRQEHAGPVLVTLAAWLADQRPRVLPKSAIGEAVTYATNQWSRLGGYVTDGRLTIDNGPAEQAIRPLAIGRKNWPHLGGAGALRPTAVLLSVTASVKRHGLDPWLFLPNLARLGHAVQIHAMVVAKVEWHAGELFPRVGFIVTNLKWRCQRLVRFYNAGVRRNNG
jgi:hypothetical protein